VLGLQRQKPRCGIHIDCDFSYYCYENISEFTIFFASPSPPALRSLIQKGVKLKLEVISLSPPPTATSSRRRFSIPLDIQQVQVFGYTHFSCAYNHMSRVYCLIYCGWREKTSIYGVFEENERRKVEFMNLESCFGRKLRRPCPPSAVIKCSIYSCKSIIGRSSEAHIA
jgi:hypothetical protein